MSDPTTGLSAAISGRLGKFELDVSFEAPARGVTALFGPSGCGKTTVLRCLAGLLHLPGRVSIGEDVWQDTTRRRFVPPYRRELGYVFQEASLFPHLSVGDNLLFGARRAVGRKAEAEEGLGEMLRLLGIEGLVDRSPTTLSGGERQRVALGRALLSRPRVLLMDEPLSALDRITKDGILPYFERIVETLDLPIVYVSHDVGEIARLARHAVIMRNGRVVRAGRTAELLGGVDPIPDGDPEDAGAVLDTFLARQHGDGLTELAFSGGSLHLPRIEGAIGATVRVRVPARDVMLAMVEPKAISALNVLAVTVEEIGGGKGPGAIVRLRCGSDDLLARVTRRSVQALGLRAGTACFAVIKSVAIAKGDVGSAIPARD